MPKLNRKSKVALVAAAWAAVASPRISRATNTDQPYATLGNAYTPTFSELPYSTGAETSSNNNDSTSPYDTLSHMWGAAPFTTTYKAALGSDWTGWSVYNGGSSSLRSQVGEPNTTTGQVFSFSSSSTNQALGAIDPGSVGPVDFGVELQNTTGGSINHLSISFQDNLWYEGTQKTLSFGYYADASNNVALNTAAAGETNVSALASTATPQSGAVNAGSFSANGTQSGTTTAPLATETLSSSFTLGTTIANNGAIWLIWSLPAAGGSQGIGFNNLSITFSLSNTDVWAPAGGNTAWDTSHTNWTVNGTASSTYANAGNDIVQFTNAGVGVVTLQAAGVDPASIAVSNTTGTYQFQNASGASAGISGSGSVTMSGTGTLDLSGLSQANTYTGGTNFNAGTVIVSNDNQLGGSSGGLAFNGGTLRTSTGITDGRAITMTGAGTFDTDSNSSTLSSGSTFTGTGTFNVIGGGTLTLQGGTPGGNTTVAASTTLVLAGTSGGTQTLATDSTTGTAFAGNLAISNPMRVSFQGGSFSGGGTISVLSSSQSATTFLNGASGTTTIGNVIVPNTSTLTSSNLGSVTLSGSGYVADTFVLGIGATGGNTLVLGNSGMGVTAYNVLNGGNSGVNFQSGQTTGGGGTVILNQQLSYNGTTQINSNGTIQLGVANALPTTTDVIVDSAGMANAATLDLHGNSQQIYSLSNGGSVSSAKFLTITSTTGAATLTVGGSTLPGNSFYGVIKDASPTGTLNLAKSGTGMLTLDNSGGAGTYTYSGTTAVSGGTLQITSGTTLASTGGISVNGGTFAGAGTVSSSLVTVGGSSTGTIVGGTYATGATPTYSVGTLTLQKGLTIGSNGAILAFGLSGSTVGNIALTGTGANGVLTLNGTGTINLSGTAFNSGTYTLLSYASHTGSGMLTLGTTPTVNGESFSNFTVGATSTTIQVTGVLGDTLAWSTPSGAVPSSSTDGGGTWSEGTTTFYDETLAATSPSAAAGAAWNSSDNYTAEFGAGGASANGGTVAISGQLTAAALLFAGPIATPYTIGTAGDITNTITLDNTTGTTGVTADNSGTINSPIILGASSTWDVASSQTLISNGTISGSGESLTKTDSGTLILAGANSYSGTTTLSSGILETSGTNSSAGQTALNGGTLQLDNTTANNGGLASGTVTLGGGTLQNATGSAVTIANPVALTASSTVSGAQSLTFSGALTQTGSRTLTSSITGGGTLTLGTVNIDSAIGTAGTLTIAGTGNTYFGGAIQDYSGGIGTSHGALTITGGNVTLAGTNTYGGGTNINGGTLSVGADANLGTTTYNASIGTVGINGGTLFVNTSGFSSGRAITLGTNGGTIDTDSNTATLSGLISGAHALTVTDGGTLTLSNASNANNSITINGATVSVGADGDLGASAGTLTFGASGGTLSTSAAITSSRPFAMTGAGTFNTNGFSSSLSGNFTGTGLFKVVGGGTVTLNGGTLGVTGDDSSSTVVLGGAGGGTQTISSTGSAFAGTLTISNAIRVSFQGGSFAGGGTINVNSSGAFLNGSGTNATTTIGNVIDPNQTGLNAGSLGTVVGSYSADSFVTGLGATSGNTLDLGVSGTSSILNGGNSGVTFQSASGTGGGGTVIVNQPLAYNGITQINSNGTIQLNVANVANANALPLGTDVIVDTNIAGTSTLDLNGTNLQIASLSNGAHASSTAFLTVLNNGAGAATLTISGNDTPANSFFGTIGGGTGVLNLVKSGSGLLKLDSTGSGASTVNGTYSYTGTTTVNGGTLQITGGNSLPNTSAVLVNAGTFGGNGTIGGAVTVGTGSGAGANLFEGSSGSVGSLTVNNNVTMNSDGMLTIRIQEPKSSEISQTGSGPYTALTTMEGKDNDTLVLTNASTFALNSSTLEVIPTGTFTHMANLNYVYTIVDATAAATGGTPANGSVSGVFANLADENGTMSNVMSQTFTDGGFTYTVNYNPNGNSDEIQLDVSSIPEPGSIGVLALGGVAMLRRRRRATWPAATKGAASIPVTA